MIIISTGTAKLADTISDSHDLTLFSCEVARFGDGESDLRCNLSPELIAHQEILFIQEYYFDDVQTINMQIMDSLFLINTIKSLRPQTITGFFPYLPYSRQEKPLIDHGQSNLSLLIKFYKEAGLDRIITGDIHVQRSLTSYALHVANIDCALFWSQYLKQILLPQYNIDLAQVILVSPDIGSSDRVAAIAQDLGCAYECLNKKRTRDGVAIVSEFKEHVAGKSVIICDDILDSAGTAAAAASLLKNAGAQQIFGCFTHGIFSGDARERLYDFRHVYTTNTIIQDAARLPSQVTVLSINQFLSEKFLSAL